MPAEDGTPPPFYGAVLRELLAAEGWGAVKQIFAGHGPVLLAPDARGALEELADHLQEPAQNVRVRVLIALLDCTSSHQGQSFESCCDRVFKFILDKYLKFPLALRSEYARVALSLLDVVSHEDYRPIWQYELAVGLLERRSGTRERDIEEALDLLQSLIEQADRDANPIFWAAARMEQAVGLLDRSQGNKRQNIRDALAYLDEAAEIFQEHDTQGLIAVTENRGDALHALSGLGEPGQVDASIDLYTEALALLGPDADPQRWAGIRLKMAHAFNHRSRGDRRQNIESAIAAFEDALGVFRKADTPHEWADATEGLAAAYRKRPSGERAENLDIAVGLGLLALHAHDRASNEERSASAHAGLGESYLERYSLRKGDDLLSARHHYVLALEAMRPDNPGYVHAVMGLAHAYAELTNDDDADLADSGIPLIERALLAVNPDEEPYLWGMVQHNLGSFHAILAQRGRAEHRALAEHHLRQAIEARPAELYPAEYMRTSRSLAGIYLESEDWAAAAAAYIGAISAAEILLEDSVTSDAQEDVISESASVFEHGAYCLLRLGRYEEAVLLAEEGLGRLLREAHWRRNVASQAGDSGDSGAAASLVAAEGELRSLEYEMRLPRSLGWRRPDDVLAAKVSAAREKLHRLWSAGHSGQTAETSKFSGSDLAKLMESKRAIVIFIGSPAGSAAVILGAGQPTLTAQSVLWLDKWDQLWQEGQHWIRSAYLLGRGVGAGEGFLPVLSRTIRQAWLLGIGALHERLAELNWRPGSHVTLVSPGGFGLLPLAAASSGGAESRPFLEDFVVSHVPSLSGLAVARQNLDRAAKTADAVLAVANPTGDLDAADLEGQLVSQVYPTAGSMLLTGNEATVPRVLQSLPSVSHVHFACHARFEWTDPPSSALHLADGLLTLSMIMSFSRLEHARLIVLSACESSLTDLRLYNENLGFPGWLMVSGAAGIVSTLWPVSSWPTTLLIHRLYLNLVTGRHEPAEALRLAQLWLRDATRSDVANVYEAWMQSSEAVRSEWIRLMLAGSPADQPFSDPFYWAGFTLTGA
jgi:tetratricopeptide (TPR) repeat protein